MKILWLVNIIVPKAAAALSLPSTPYGGWIPGQIELLRREPNIELCVCCASTAVGALRDVTVDGVRYCVLSLNGEQYMEEFPRLLSEVSPDVVHIFGTEMPWNDRMSMLVEPDRLVVSIQGLIFKYAQIYAAGMPAYYKHVHPLKLLMTRLRHGDTVEKNRREMIKLGETEKAVIRRLRYIIGRTSWDREAALSVNPKLRYFFCNECLRDSFYYSEPWQLSACARYSVFVSQGNYPIKGLHQLLKAFPAVLARFPQAHIYVAGEPQTRHENPVYNALSNYLYEYNGYINKLLDKLALRANVTFTGRLNEEEMRRQYLRAHLFASVSAAENSPNSVAEAMVLGVPVVSSAVGGVGDWIRDGENGLLYAFDDVDLLAKNIIRIFEDDALARRLSANERASQTPVHDREKNTAALLSAYKEICANRNGGRI